MIGSCRGNACKTKYTTLSEQFQILERDKIDTLLFYLYLKAINYYNLLYTDLYKGINMQIKIKISDLSQGPNIESLRGNL
jgi:hypothetical protein